MTTATEMNARAPKIPAGIYPDPPITTYEGWRAFVNKEQPKRPVVPTPAQWESLPGSDKAASKRERAIWHAEMPPLETSAVTKINQIVTRLATLNYRAAPGARPGVAVDGLGAVGKSTILMEIGRGYERSVRKRFHLGPNDDLGLNEFIPVVYVTLPGTEAVKQFDWELVHYYGLPMAKSSTQERLDKAIEKAAIGCGTTLFLIDDIHFLKLSNRSAQVVNNHIKSLASRIPATFVYAGIDLDRSGLLAEGRSDTNRELSQTDHRFTRCEVRSFDCDSKEFDLLLSAFEAALCLVKTVKGDLVRMKVYVHQRTNGFIGAIAHLLKEGANLAIRNGEERITQSLLDKITISRAAELHSIALSGRRS